MIKQVSKIFSYFTGPSSWWVHYPDACGKSQSPIDIDTEVAEFDVDLVTYPLKICWANASKKILLNTGNGLQVEVKNRNSCK